jgi:hypothetical protein
MDCSTKSKRDAPIEHTKKCIQTKKGAISFAVFLKLPTTRVASKHKLLRRGVPFLARTCLEGTNTTRRKFVVDGFFIAATSSPTVDISSGTEAESAAGAPMGVPTPLRARRGRQSVAHRYHG